MIAFHLAGSTAGSTDFSLADAVPGDLVEVGVIAFDFVRAACWHLAIRPGAILQCVERRPEVVLAARSDGTRVRVPHECARFIGVRTLQQHLEAGRLEMSHGRKRPPAPGSSVH